MRNEPDRYKVRLKDKERIIQISYCYRWMSFSFVSENREEAERICQNLINQIESYNPKWEDVGRIIKLLCPDWRLYEIMF